MSGIEELIREAWRTKVLPRLLKDPKEFQRRKARMCSRSLSRPPRAWCLAIRASDRRINGYIGDPRPEQLRQGQEVWLDSNMLGELCRPIELPPYGDTWDRVAGQLGTGPRGLHAARIGGRLKARYVPGLAGRSGKPVAILSADSELDPNARGFDLPDPAWTWTARYLTRRIPDDLLIHAKRVPVYRETVSARHSQEDLHAEAREPRVAECPHLPPPPPDYVWYKWSMDGRYLGDDPRCWRKHPEDPGTPSPHRPSKPARRRKPRGSVAGGSLAFRGWMWLCPICGKKTRTLYLPLATVSLLEPARGHGQEASAGCRSSLGCFTCHRVRSFSRIDRKNSWNEVVSYLSGGLLYGREVERPKEFDLGAARKREYRPRLRAAPRRQQVLRRMLNGWTIKQIARDLRIHKAQVCDCIRKLCRQEGVGDRRELAEKLGSPHPQPMDSDRIAAAAERRQRVREMLISGMSYRQIMQQTGTKVSVMEQDVNVIYRSAGVRNRAEFIRKALCGPAGQIFRGPEGSLACSG